MIKYQIPNWDSLFENNRSREIDCCSFVLVPNKQHGLTFARVMAEPDGAAIYGIWVLILEACSQQKKPRRGWLTVDGHHDGTSWAPQDLALKLRRPVAEITRSLDFLSSPLIGWLTISEVVESEVDGSNCRPGAVQVPSKCYRTEQNGMEQNLNTPISPILVLEVSEPPNSLPAISEQLFQTLNELFHRRPSTLWSAKEKKALALVAKSRPTPEELALIQSFYSSSDPYKRKDVVTLLNNWNGEIDRAKLWREKRKSPADRHLDATLKRMEQETNTNLAKLESNFL